MESSEPVWENPENIIEMLRSRAELCVPEWKLDLDHPDMGTVLALVFADEMAATAKHFKQAVSRYPVQLYNMLGADILPPGEARGYLTFETVNDEVPGIYVDKGIKVSGEAEGERADFETEEDIFVSPARFQAAYYVDGERDLISAPLSFPLGDEELANRQDHVLLIGHSCLFRLLTEGEISLDLCPLPSGRGKIPDPSVIERIRWSYYSEDGFVPFGACRYEEGKLHLEKNRDMPVFCETKWRDKNSFWIRAEMEGLPPGETVSFPGLSVTASGSDIRPDSVFDGNMELDRDSFLLFGERPYVFQEIFLCSEEVLAKRGAQITISFDLEMEEYPGDIQTPEPPVQWKNIMREQDFPVREPPVNVAVSAVSLEYYNGLGFTRIPGTKAYTGMFGEGAREGSVEIRFVCPEDICPCLVSAKETWCVRFRVSGLTNPYAVDGVYRVPRIGHCALSYRYGPEGRRAEHIFCRNQLVEKELSCTGEIAPFYNLFPARNMLYLVFTGPLNEESIRLMFQITEEDGAQGFPCQYEYYGRQGWTELHVFDDTVSLSRTGILSLLTSHHFERQDFFGHSGYWIRILWRDGNAGGKRRMPPIRGIFINSVPVSAVPGSGRSGNLPAGALETLERSVGFVNRVENKEATSGGYACERADQAVKRNAAALRHRGRAVTARDFEDIVTGSVRNISQARCFSGRDGRGERAPGHIALAVLPQRGELHFDRIRRSVSECLRPYMDSRLFSEGRLHIVEPEWVSIRVYMTLVAEAAVKSYVLREKVRERIQAFMDPETGNFDGGGWRIGTLPTAVQISNACDQIEGVLYISHISLDRSAEGGIYALGISDRHEIEIIPEGGLGR